MKRILLFLAFAVLAAPVAAQQPPLFATTKITDNVYQFRYGGHQAMFVVTPEGVIATDPIGYRRPQAVREAAAQGKCWDAAMKEIRLPKYEKLANYESGLAANVERFCSYWGRGY